MSDSKHKNANKPKSKGTKSHTDSKNSKSSNKNNRGWTMETTMDGKITLAHHNPTAPSTNKKPKTSLKKKAPFDVHKRFFEDEGLDIYAYARSQGYSVAGSLFLMTLAAQESGYGDSTALNKFEKLNNFFGVDAGKRKFNSEEEGIEYVLERNRGLFARKYPIADSLLRQDTFDIGKLDKALKGYNLDPNGVNYATWLRTNDEKGVKNRAKDSIPNIIGSLQNEVNNYKASNALHDSKTFPFFPDATDNDNMGMINTIQSEINDLQHIQQELQTGQPVNTPFNVPDMPNWQKPKTNDIDPSLLGPVHFNPDTTGGQAAWPDAYMYKPQPSSAPAAPVNHSTQLMPPHSAHKPAAHAMRSIHKPAAAHGKAGGNVSVNVHTNDNFHTHSATAPNDIYNTVVAVLANAVGDSRIGIDLH